MPTKRFWIYRITTDGHKILLCCRNSAAKVVEVVKRRYKRSSYVYVIDWFKVDHGEDGKVWFDEFEKTYKGEIELWKKLKR